MPHVTAKCANCGGPHGARTDACTAKKIAQQATRGVLLGWRPQPPRRKASWRPRMLPSQRWEEWKSRGLVLDLFWG